MKEVTVIGCDINSITEKDQSRFINVINDIIKLKKYVEVNLPILISNEIGDYLVLSPKTLPTDEIIRKYNLEGTKINILTGMYKK